VISFADRVKETTATTGTGTITLGGAVSGFQSFTSAFSGNGASTQLYYAMSDGTNWEVGIGTFTVSGDTLSRQYVLASSNSGALVNFPGSSTTVWNDLPALLAGGLGIPTTLTTALLIPVGTQFVFVTDLQPTNGDILVNGILEGVH
jgi:hypothetical protein